jgi:hypothetical protein
VELARASLHASIASTTVLQITLEDWPNGMHLPRTGIALVDRKAFRISIERKQIFGNLQKCSGVWHAVKKVWVLLLRGYQLLIFLFPSKHQIKV